VVCVVKVNIQKLNNVLLLGSVSLSMSSNLFLAACCFHPVNLVYSLSLLFLAIVVTSDCDYPSPLVLSI